MNIKKTLYNNKKGGGSYGIGLNSPKGKLAIALFTLNFLDIRRDNTEPAATIHWANNQAANDLLSKKETLQQTQQVLCEDSKSWKKGNLLKQGRSYALILTEENEHRWIPKRKIQLWKEKDLFEPV